MKTLYEILKIVSSFICYFWLFYNLRHFRDNSKAKDSYERALYARKSLKRLCFFTLLLGILYFALTALEFYLKIKFHYNLIGIFALVCYIVGQIGLGKLDKSIEEEEKKRNFKK